MTAPEFLNTSRLTLRKPALGDAPLLFDSYTQDPEVTRFLMWRPHTSVADSEAFLERSLKQWNEGSEFGWLMCTHSDGAVIGLIAARIKPDEIELGYVLARPFWGQGLMLEAITAVVEWAFVQPWVFRVSAACDLENHASARVLEKAGFVREGVLKDYSVLPNLSEVPRDCYLYAKPRFA